MPYAVVINLDHEHDTYENCRILWGEIRSRMIKAGFRMDGRRFVINLPDQEAGELARAVIEGIEQDRDFSHKRIYNHLRDFYGYDTACTQNLMVPPASSIQVREMRRAQ
jgi:hypothetical protein